MSKSKLEILLEEVGKLTLPPLLGDLANAYQAYMEERKTLPQAGQEIEVTDHKNQEWVIQKFIGFAEDCRVVTESTNGIIECWKHYRIPTPKKNWKVVKDSYGFRLIFPQDHPTELPIITTFED